MHTPLNILLTDASDIYGGGEFFVLSLAQELVKRELRVWVSCRSDNLLNEKCIAAGIPVLPVDFPSNGRLTHHIGVLSGFIGAHAIDIVHSNNNYDRTAGAFAASRMRRRHVTNIHSFHSIQHNLTHWIRNRIATDHFIVDGYCVKDLLIREDGIPASKISVVHLGLNPESMKNSPDDRRRIRNRYDIKDDEILIGNVGRFVPMKGQEYLVKAFAEVAGRQERVKLLLVGDGELRGTLESLASSLGITSRVIFAGFSDELGAMYSSFDVYAHSSVEEGGETFPFAVLQAIAQRLPAVVTRVGDVAAMVEDGVNGYVVADADAHELAEKLLMLIENPGSISRMGEESHNRFMRLFTSQSMVDGIIDVYMNIVTK